MNNAGKSGLPVTEIALLVLMALAKAVIYSNTHNNQFVLDDIPAIQENQPLKSAELSLSGLINVVKNHGYYASRPIPVISFALTYHFFKEDVFMFDWAIGYFQTLTKLDPANAKAHGNPGCAYRLANNNAAAMHQLKRSIEIDPDWVLPHNSLDVICLKQKNIPNAIVHFEQAVRVDPGYLLAHHNLAQFYIQTKQYKQGMTHFRRIATLAPNAAEAFNNLGVTLMLNGETEQAIAVFKSALQVDPANTKAKNYMNKAMRER